MIRSGRHMVIPDIMSVRVRAPASAVAAIPWYLSGGVSAANCVAAYQPIGAASLAASYTNLAHPGTYDAAPGTAPAWAAATGWTFSLPSSQYLTTGITPTNGSWSAICRFSNIGAAANYLICGDYSIYNNISLAPSSLDVAGQDIYANWGLHWGGATTSGTMAVAAQTAYLNGAAVTSFAYHESGAAAALYIGARNNGGAPAGHLNGAIQALAIYSATLTADQVAAITTAMAALTG